MEDTDSRAPELGPNMTVSDFDPRLIISEGDDDGTVVVSLKDSYLNYAAADVMKPRLKKLLGEEMDAGRKRFVVNLASVGVIDSCGLAVLISLKKLVDGRGGSLVLSNMSVMIRRLFLLTRLDKAFDIHETAEEAIRAG